VDGPHQPLATILAAMGPKEVNRLRLGALELRTVHTLRHIKDFLDVEYDIKTDEESRTANLTCIGSGIRNTSRKVQ
jgi:RNA 3'-terminal phosphate cyclase-like protein